MAVAAGVRQVHVTEDGAFAVQRDIIVDPTTGRAAAVEKVVVAVPTDDGGVAVMEQQRVRLVDNGGPPQRPAITAPNYGARQPSSSYQPQRVNNDEAANPCLLLMLCLLCILCPCCIIVWLCLRCMSDD